MSRTTWKLQLKRYQSAGERSSPGCWWWWWWCHVSRSCRSSDQFSRFSNSKLWTKWSNGPMQRRTDWPPELWRRTWTMHSLSLRLLRPDPFGSTAMMPLFHRLPSEATSNPALDGNCEWCDTYKYTWFFWARRMEIEYPIDFSGAKTHWSCIWKPRLSRSNCHRIIKSFAHIKKNMVPTTSRSFDGINECLKF